MKISIKVRQMFLVLAVLFVSVPFFAVSSPVSASTNEDNIICRIFPFIAQIGFTQSLCGREGTEGEAVNTVADILRFGLSLIFIAIIGISVFYIIKSAIKYIRSEGDEGQIQESTKAIKAVFIGIGALIVSILGLVILLAFFGGTDAISGQNTENSGVQLVDDFLNRLIQ